MVQAIEEARGAEIAAAMTGRIRSGEELLVRRGEGGIEVFHAGEPPVRNARPELYGQLLKASEQIASAGTSTMWVVGLLSILICASIHLGWIDHLSTMRSRAVAARDAGTSRRDAGPDSRRGEFEDDSLALEQADPVAADSSRSLKLKSVWTYVLILVGGFIVGMYWMEFLGARVYQTWKKTLVEGLAEAQLSHLDLLAQIEGHAELKAVADKIKRDPRFEIVD